jgi:hypothetical protein
VTADLSFDEIDPVYRGFIDDCVGLYGLDAARFRRLPLPGADEMFFKAILPNFEGDTSIAAYKWAEATMRHYEAYRQIVSGVFGGFESLASVLDFASGWGRLTRVLEQKLPADRIWVSDIYADAAAWQAKVFGVHAAPSTPDPKALKLKGGHDLIFVGSMFSHLPDALFRAWLARLYGLLSKRGVLAFSVHDESFLPAGEARDPSGITYLRFSESGSLDADIYGMSYVTEAYVADAIAQLGGGLFGKGRPTWRRYPKGLYENQDLYVVAAPGVDISGLTVASPPMGGFETATVLTTGEVEWSGWTLERTPGQSIARIAAYVDGRPGPVVAPGGERPDVLDHFPAAANAPRAWRLRLGPDVAGPGATLRLGLESTSGLTGYLHAQVPSGGALTYAGWSRRAQRNPA